MTIQSSHLLVGTLTDLRLLRPPQLDELARSAAAADPRSLARELIQRGWLTPYQVNQLFQGRGPDLTLSPYVILDRLGEGGAGQVFKARHAAMQRVVALKVIRPELLNDPEVVGRFYREVQVLSQLSHPNVVHAYDAGPAGPTHFLVMEYLEGRDLAQVVGQSGPLPADQACCYIRQAAAGLQHAYERGLVHRDIKPSNLFVARTDGAAEYPWGQVKLLDLGLARLRPTTDGSATAPLTEVGATTMGTVDYMAPEQALDFHAVDIRADVYSLGCSLYFLLTGQPPFGAGTMAQKLMRHQQSPPPDVRAVRPDVPPHVALALQKMMAKRPEDRFQAPADAAAALAAPVAVLAPPQASPRRRWVPVVGAAAAVLLAALGWGAWALVPSASARRPEASPSGVAAAPPATLPTSEPGTAPRPAPARDLAETFTLQGRAQSRDAILDPQRPEAEYRGDALARGQTQNSAWLIAFSLDRLNLPPKLKVRRGTLAFFVWDPHDKAPTHVAAFPVKSFWADSTWVKRAKTSGWQNGPFNPALDLGPPAATVKVLPDPVNDTVDPPLKYELDVTEMVRNWVERGAANHGLAVMPVADRAVDGGAQSRFQVRRVGAAQQQYAPRLTVETGP